MSYIYKKNKMNNSEQIFRELTSYPLPREIIRNRKFVPRSPTITTTFHDLISLNLDEIIPNIHLGLHHEYSLDSIENWTRTTQMYYNKINEEYNEKIEKQLYLLQKIKEQQILREKFDTTKVKNLPPEIELNILSFLDPETRLIHLEENNKNVKEDMKKWKVSDFKIFYRDIVVKKYIEKTFDYSSKAGIERIDYHLTINNKKEYINEIFKTLTTLKAAIPKDYNKYIKYKQLATSLFCSLLYLNKKLLMK